MPRKTTKRRSPHEGGAYSYKTGKGERWYWKAVITQPDGTVRQKAKRGFETKQAALADLREALAASAKGGYAEPSRQLLGAYLAGWTACGWPRRPWRATARTCGCTSPRASAPCRWPA